MMPGTPRAPVVTASQRRMSFLGAKRETTHSSSASTTSKHSPIYSVDNRHPFNAHLDPLQRDTRAMQDCVMANASNGAYTDVINPIQTRKRRGSFAEESSKKKAFVDSWTGIPIHGSFEGQPTDDDIVELLHNGVVTSSNHHERVQPSANHSIPPSLSQSTFETSANHRPDMVAIPPGLLKELLRDLVDGGLECAYDFQNKPYAERRLAFRTNFMGVLGKYFKSKVPHMPSHHGLRPETSARLDQAIRNGSSEMLDHDTRAGTSVPPNRINQAEASVTSYQIKRAETSDPSYQFKGAETSNPLQIERAKSFDIPEPGMQAASPDCLSMVIHQEKSEISNWNSGKERSDLRQPPTLAERLSTSKAIIQNDRRSATPKAFTRNSGSLIPTTLTERSNTPKTIARFEKPHTPEPDIRAASPERCGNRTMLVKNRFVGHIVGVRQRNRAALEHEFNCSITFAPDANDANTSVLQYYGYTGRPWADFVRKVSDVIDGLEKSHTLRTPGKRVGYRKSRN